jgi:uncharacterized membrane protein YfcA
MFGVETLEGGSGGLLLILATTLVASVVNGAIGYGFSSVTVPVALTVVPQRVLNPALVLAEVVLNAASLWMNRGALRSAWPHALPVLVGLVPGILVGSALLVAATALALKTATYLLLLPIIVWSAVQVRSHVPRADEAGPAVASTGRWRAFGRAIPFGTGLGALYAATTISGPPLALYMTRRDLAPDAFRAAVAVVRVAESAFTLVVYATLGMLVAPSPALALAILPTVVIGLPLGRALLRRMSAERFRRVVLVVDALLVSVGLMTCLHAWKVPVGLTAVAIALTMAAVVAIALRQRTRMVSA